MPPRPEVTEVPGDSSPAWEIDQAGFLLQAQHLDSPNADERPHGTVISLLVIHGISLPAGRFEGDAVERLFTNRLDCDSHPDFAILRDLRVSAHFYIRRDGSVCQFVSCLRRAWHAGVSSWQGRSRCNDFSIGVELQGTDALPYQPAQYQALRRLRQAVQARFPIDSVVGHADIAPGRKTDPGAAFDWAQL
jgi:AmpD protein